MAATLKCDTIQNASSSTANLTLDASGNATVGNTLVMGSSFKRNKIINGDMRVDQRNAGASVTGNNAVFGPDRWKVGATQSSKFTVQQSTTAPTGFKNSLLITSSSAYSVGASDEFEMIQFIEGYNIADLGWGAAGALSVTLSFWVRSSLTGTFGGVLYNSAINRCYIFSYTINNANTFEQKSITIPGDTTGTWLTDNGQGVGVLFCIGAGSSLLSTAGSWGSTFYRGPAGQTSIVGTNGATFYLTGVQFEVGSVATPYERQIYSEQLAQCQRYYFKTGEGGSEYTQWGLGRAYSGTAGNGLVIFPVPMRAAPTFNYLGSFSDYDFTPTAISGGAVPSANNQMTVGYTFSSITSGSTYILGANAGTSGPAGFTFSAEL